jgi:peptidoglycan/LPS O-acetylase OafA/YrhL
MLLLPPFLWPLDQSPITPTVGVLCLALGFAGILLLCLSAAPRSRLRRPIMRPVKSALALIGFHSYSIYLWHMPVQVILTPIPVAAVLPATATPDIEFAFKTGVYLTIAVLVGIWIGRLIEQPSLSTRDRFFPTRAGGLVNRPQVLPAAEELAPVVLATR